MLFKRKKTEPSGPDPAADDAFDVDAVPESHRVPHRRYTVIPKTKQLHNGNWIVAIVLQEERADGSRPRCFRRLGKFPAACSFQVTVDVRLRVQESGDLGVPEVLRSGKGGSHIDATWRSASLQFDHERLEGLNGHVEGVL